MSITVTGLVFTSPDDRGTVLADGLASVQLTADLLRGEDDNEIATYEPATGGWVTPDSQHFSDLVIEVAS